MTGKPIKLVTEPADFFRELVTSAMSNQKVQTRPETEFYLVNLLNHFMSTENLFSRDAEGHYREEPLALMVKEAFEQTERRQQELMFRHVGDVSLYVAGYFQDRLYRKSVDINYYIQLGGSAYDLAAQRVEERVLKETFSELADKFPRLVSVLAEIGDKTTLPSEKDLLRTYEIWVETRDERAKKRLENAGINPIKAFESKKKH